MNRALVPFLLSVLALGSCARPTHAPLVVSPSRIAQAVSSDVDLCRATSATVIMDRVDDADGPLLEEALVQEPDEPCVWRSAGETLLPRGRYKLLVRFDAVPRDGSACGEDATVPIGAYLIPEVDFPFGEDFRGLREEDFLSLVDQSVPAEGLDFDPDDDGRDSLAEVSIGGDPCTTNEPPVVTVEQIEGTPVDEETIKLRVASVATAGDIHQLHLAVTHENGAAAGSAEIAFRASTDGSAPVLPEAPAGEGWELTVFTGDDDESDGAASYDLFVRLDEPFVGNVTVRAFATLDGVTPIANAPALELEVADVEDETLILDADFQPLDRLDVPEVRSELLPFPNENDADFQARRRQDLLDIAGPVVIRVEDEDLDDDVSVLDARLSVAECPDLTSITREAGAFTFRWAAQNADAVAEAENGEPRTCAIELVDADDVVKGTAQARLFVSPLKNDPPSFGAPASAALGLPAGTFAEHTVPFVVVDPDQIETPPACTPALTPRGTTGCTAAEAFTTITCTPNGPRDGEQWPFALVLTPAADYFTACGADPSFDVALTIEDASPDGSDAPLSIQTCTGGNTVDCGPAFFLRTARAVEQSVLELAGPFSSFDDVAPIIDAGTGLGLMRVPDGAGDRVLGLVELTGAQAPRVVSVSPPDVASRFELTDLRRRGAADGTGRFLTAVRDGGGTQVVLRVDASAGAASATYTQLSLQTQCQESFTGTLGAFLADRAGNLYLTCNGDSDNSPPARLVRFAPDGTRTDVPLNGLVVPLGRFEGEHISVVVDPTSDTEWIVWPDAQGFVLIDTASIDTTLVTQQVSFTWPANQADLDDVAFEPERGLFLFLHEADSNNDGSINLGDNDDATLSSIVFDGSPALGPALPLPEASPLDANGSLVARIAVRPFDAATPADEADVIIHPGFGPPPRIDVDAFTVVSSISVLDLLAFGPGIYPSPDARFVISQGCDADFGNGMALYPFDGGATQFLDLDASCATTENPDSFTVSIGAFVAALIDDGGDLRVFDFVDARAGLD